MIQKNNFRKCKVSFLSVICASLFVIIAVIIRGYTGNPYRIINHCDIKDLIPSVWVMTIIWILWFVLLGIAFGSIFSGEKNNNNENKYKCGMLFTTMMALEYAWYPMFFGKGALFLALLICECVLLLSVFCFISFLRINLYYAMIMCGFSLWMIWMVILNFIVFINC